MKRISQFLVLPLIGIAFILVAAGMTLMTKLGLKKAPPSQYGARYFW